MDITTGFPSCPNLDNYTIIGHIKDAVFKSDGSLIIDDIFIPKENFCIEQINEDFENNFKSFKIFSCSEHTRKG